MSNSGSGTPGNSNAERTAYIAFSVSSPANTMAYACGLMYVACSVWSFVLVGSVGGGLGTVWAVVAVLTLPLAVAMLARYDLARRTLLPLGLLATLLCLYTLISASQSAVTLVALVLWLLATVVLMLPATARATRGYQRRLREMRQPNYYGG